MKIKHFEFSGREAVSIVLLILFSLGATSFVNRQFPDNPTYAVAQQLREQMTNGASASFFVQITSILYKVAALVLSGTTAFNSGILVAFLTIAPPILAALTSLFVYLALRDRGFKAFECLIVSLLFSSVPLVIMMNSSGVYSASALALLFASAGLFAFSESNPLRGLVAGVLFSLTYLISPSALVLVLALVLAGLFGLFMRGFEKKAALAHGACLIPLVIAVAAMPIIPAPSVELISVYSDFRLLIPLALASLSALMKKDSQPYAYYAVAMALLAIPAGLFMPLALPLLLVVPAALGATMLLSTANTKNENSVAWFLFLFAFFLAFLDVGGADPVKEMLLAAVSATGILIVLYIYDFRYHLAPFSAIGFLVAFALFSSLLIASSPSLQASSVHGFAFSSIDSDTHSALSWVRDNTPKTADVAYIGESGAFTFVSERILRESDSSALAKFLSSSAPASDLRSAGIGYAIVTVDVLDNPEKIRELSSSSYNPESYAYYATMGSGGVSTYALFRATNGDMLARPLGQDGNFALANSELVDKDGRLLANIPFSQLRMLNDNLSYTEPANRVIQPGAAYTSNAFRAFFEDIPGLATVYKNGTAMVLKVS